MDALDKTYRAASNIKLKKPLPTFTTYIKRAVNDYNATFNTRIKSK